MNQTQNMNMHQISTNMKKQQNQTQNLENQLNTLLSKQDSGTQPQAMSKNNIEQNIL